MERNPRGISARNIDKAAERKYPFRREWQKNPPPD